MRWVLITIAILGLALVALSLLGQASAFYLWHEAGIELRQIASQIGDSTQRTVDTVVFRHYPQATYWFAIRLSGIAVTAIALIGLWIQKKKETRI